MRVTIDHVEKEIGLVFKKKLHGVKCHIQFSQEELQIINERGLQNELILERDPSADAKVYENDNLEKFYLILRDLIRGPETYYVTNPFAAKQYEDEFMAMMPNLKSFITENTGIEEKSKTVEF